VISCRKISVELSKKWLFYLNKEKGNFAWSCKFFGSGCLIIFMNICIWHVFQKSTVTNNRSQITSDILIFLSELQNCWKPRKKIKKQGKLIYRQAQIKNWFLNWLMKISLQSELFIKQLHYALIWKTLSCSLFHYNIK
jgi:hypothetical protein